MSRLRAGLAVVGVLALTACGGGDQATVGSRDASVAAILRDDGRFETLVRILESASVRSGPPGAQTRLGSALEVMDRPDWQHTIFAPTDNAFASLDEATLESPFDEPNATAFARSYTVPSLIQSSELESGMLQMIRGVVQVKVDADGITFGNARVVESDIRGNNAIIHVLDGVNPPA